MIAPGRHAKAWHHRPGVPPLLRLPAAGHEPTIRLHPAAAASSADLRDDHAAAGAAGAQVCMCCLLVVGAVVGEDARLLHLLGSPAAGQRLEVPLSWFSGCETVPG